MLFLRSPPEFTRSDYQRDSRIIESRKFLNIMRDTKTLAELEEVAWEEWKELAFHSLYSASVRRADGIQADQNNGEAAKTGLGITEAGFNILKRWSFFFFFFFFFFFLLLLLLLLLFRIARSVQNTTHSWGKNSETECAEAVKIFAA